MSKLTPEQTREAEANYFAMCLLMPEAWLRADVKMLCPNGIDLESDPAIKKLADKYHVSRQLMVIRLCRLKLMAL